MADREIVLPRAGDVWEFKRSGDRCRVDRVYRRSGASEPIVDVTHPLQILNERRLSWFLKAYRFVEKG
jgi:hypothetical protein